MKRHLLKYYFLCLLVWLGLDAKAQIPSRPNPPRLVNDFAQIFTPSQVNTLERTLVAFNDSTSNQIVIVTVNDLGGYDKAQFAYEIGESWKVGQEKFDNGVVILIKPKTAKQYGEVFIAPGYGLEGVLPDAICKRIIDNYMIPHFQQDDYYGGVVDALNIIMPLAKGEYSEVLDDNGAGIFFGALLIFLAIIILILILIGRNGPKNLNGGNKSGDFWKGAMIGGMLGRGSHSGSWGGFSGGGGGFGGFGGGSFGGGGAGGRW